MLRRAQIRDQNAMPESCAMPDDREIAIRYLERAVQLRCIAECMKDDQNRQTLQRLADDYRGMAEALLKKTAAKSPLRQP